jgi:hypothetical protein
MPYKVMTPEIREKQRLRVKEWRQNNPDKVKFQHSIFIRSTEGRDRELLRCRRNYEKLKIRKLEYRIFKEAMPLFLFV